MKNHKKEETNHQNSREKLLDASMGLFSEKGYASTSVREIVSKAGVTKPVLYYYFKNKEGIFRAIMESAVEKQEDLLNEVMEVPGNTLERLIELYQKTYEGVSENRALFRMIHNLIFGPPQGAPNFDLEQFHLRMVSAIKKIYADGIDKNEVIRTNSDDVAILFLSLIDFCFHMYHVNPDFLDPIRPERLFRLAFNGLSKRNTN